MSTKPRKVINWFEIAVTDLRKSAALYSAMLDVNVEIVDFGGVAHAMFDAHEPGRTSGALVSAPSQAPTPGPGTTIYFDASDGVARCLARAVEAGAKVVQPLTSIDPHGKIALVADFDGNIIGLHEEPQS